MENNAPTLSKSEKDIISTGNDLLKRLFESSLTPEQCAHALDYMSMVGKAKLADFSFSQLSPEEQEKYKSNLSAKGERGEG